MRRIFVVMVFWGLVMGCFGVVETPEIDFSDPGTFVADGEVYILRDSVDEMLLKDTSITSAVRLWTLVNAGGVSDHGGLTGLGNDDHSSIYYNFGRLGTKFGSSEAGSGAVYVGSLPISGDVGGSDNIGEHVADGGVHYARPGGIASVAKIDGQFSSIQSAINYLDTNYDGGIVDIAGGVYTEKITVSDNISIRGTLGATTIQWGGEGDAIVTMGVSATAYLDGVELRGTNTKGNVQAIVVGSTGILYVNNCEFYFDSPDTDQTILVEGNLYISNSTIIAREAIIKNTNNIDIIGCRIVRLFGGSPSQKVLWMAGFEDDIRDTIIETWSTTYGIYFEGDDLYMDNVRLYQGGDKTAIFVDAGSNLFTHGCAFDRKEGSGNYYEINEGWTTGKRFNVDKVDGEVDDAYRYRMDEEALFWVDFEGNIYAAGNIQALNFTGGGSGVVSVAKEGGDYQTIQDAVDGITTGVILIYPGVYEEEVTINKSYITLIGWDKTKCIIQGTPAGAKRDLVRVYNTGGPISNVTIANLTIYNNNTWGGGGSIAQEALDFGEPSGGAHAVTGCRVYNCILKGYQDTIFCYPNSEVIWENCYIWGGFDIASNWNADVEYRNCHFHSMHTLGASIGFHTGGTVIVEGSLFTSEIIGTAGAWDLQSSSLTLYFYNNTYGDGIDRGIYFDTVGGAVYAGGNFGDVIEPSIGVTWVSIGGITVQNNINIADIWNITDTFLTSTFAAGANVNMRFLVYDFGALGVRQEWGTGSPNVFDTNLYRNTASAILTTDNPFSAASYNVGATERISSAGNGVFVGLQSNNIIWQDYPVVTAGNGNVAAFDVQDSGPTPYLATGWMINAVTAPTYALTFNDAACAYFPIPYLAGSVLTRARVKWQAQGDGDGVKLRLVKRDESGATTGWTVVGAQQTYTDAGAPYDVTVSTYDFADETMGANTAYALEVESEVAATGSNLFSVGIETNKRTY